MFVHEVLLNAYLCLPGKTVFLGTGTGKPCPKPERVPRQIVLKFHAGRIRMCVLVLFELQDMTSGQYKPVFLKPVYIIEMFSWALAFMFICGSPVDSARAEV